MILSTGDVFNVVGIIFELVGFVLVLPSITRTINKFYAVQDFKTMQRLSSLLGWKPKMVIGLIVFGLTLQIIGIIFNTITPS